MSQETLLPVHIGEIKITPENKLTERKAYSVQKFLLGSEENPAAGISLYLDSGFYSAYWGTDLPPDSLVDLVEECLADYETQYRDGVKALDAKVIDPFGKDIEKSDSAFPIGVLFRVKEFHDTSETPSYQRPLTWQQCVESAGDKEVSLLRINTPIAHFFINTQSKKNNFGIISNIKPPGGFIDMMEKSTDGEITAAEALQLFEEAYLSFTDYFGQREFYSREQRGIGKYINIFLDLIRGSNQ